MLTRRTCLTIPLVALAANHARSQALSRTAVIVVPYAAGGTADILARLVAEALRTELGRSTIVESKPGAAGTLGADAVAKAAADGNTLLFTAGGPLTIGPLVSKNVRYDTDRDFVPIGLVAQVPSFLVVNPASPFTTAGALVAAAKQSPGRLKFASPGVGTSVHLLCELFRLESGFEALHVPYRGGAPAVNDLVGGHVDFLFENVPQLLPQVQAGALRALAVSSPKRLSVAPDVPTLAEIGIQDAGVGTWYGLLAPARLPADAANQLQTALQKITLGEEFRKRLATLALEPEFLGGDSFRQFIREDAARWKKTIERANIPLP